MGLRITEVRSEEKREAEEAKGRRTETEKKKGKKRRGGRRRHNEILEEKDVMEWYDEKDNTITSLKMKVKMGH